MGFAKTCIMMTQPGFEPATSVGQTAAKTARLRELLLQIGATISGYIPSMPQLGFEPATFMNRNRNRTRCMAHHGFEPATSVFQTAAKTARLRELLLLAQATISGYIPSCVRPEAPPPAAGLATQRATQPASQHNSNPASSATWP